MGAACSDEVACPVPLLAPRRVQARAVLLRRGVHRRQLLDRGAVPQRLRRPRPLLPRPLPLRAGARGPRVRRGDGPCAGTARATASASTASAPATRGIRTRLRGQAAGAPPRAVAGRPSSPPLPPSPPPPPPRRCRSPPHPGSPAVPPRLLVERRLPVGQVPLLPRVQWRRLRRAHPVPGDVLSSRHLSGRHLPLRAGVWRRRLHRDRQPAAVPAAVHVAAPRQVPLRQVPLHAGVCGPACAEVFRAPTTAACTASVKTASASASRGAAGPTAPTRGRSAWATARANGRCRFGQCECDVGWSLSDCSRPVEACAGGCSGQGACRNGKCFCEPGFGGPDCSLIDACHHDGATCSGHGLCAHGQCRLRRPRGTRGRFCAAALACPANCSSRGICRNGRCTCDPGAGGPDCALVEACPDNCHGHGRCEFGKCVCLPGRSGPACEWRRRARTAVRARRGLRAQCHCYPGHTGPDCAIEVPCLNNCSGARRLLAWQVLLRPRGDGARLLDRGHVRVQLLVARRLPPGPLLLRPGVHRRDV